MKKEPLGFLKAVNPKPRSWLLWSTTSQGKTCHLAAIRGSLRLMMATLIGMGVSWSHAKTPCREEGKNTGRSSAQVGPFRAPQELSIRWQLKLPPTEKVGWISKQEAQTRLGSLWLRAFAASRVPMRELQEVARSHESEKPDSLEVPCVAMGFDAAVRTAFCRSPDGLFFETGIRLYWTCGNL